MNFLIGEFEGGAGEGGWRVSVCVCMCMNGGILCMVFLMVLYLVSLTFR